MNEILFPDDAPGFISSGTLSTFLEGAQCKYPERTINAALNARQANLIIIPIIFVQAR